MPSRPFGCRLSLLHPRPCFWHSGLPLSFWTVLHLPLASQALVTNSLGTESRLPALAWKLSFPASYYCVVTVSSLRMVEPLCLHYIWGLLRLLVPRETWCQMHSMSCGSCSISSCGSLGTLPGCTCLTPGMEPHLLVGTDLVFVFNFLDSGSCPELQVLWRPRPRGRVL